MIFTVAVIGTTVLLTGCSIFNRKVELVAVTVKPNNASVVANGVNYSGPFPQFIEVDPSRQLMITVFKQGYQDQLYVVPSQLSSTGKIDAWASILLIPALGLFSNGAWEVTEHNLNFELQPLSELVEEVIID